MLSPEMISLIAVPSTGAKSRDYCKTRANLLRTWHIACIGFGMGGDKIWKTKDELAIKKFQKF